MLTAALPTPFRPGWIDDLLLHLPLRMLGHEPDRVPPAGAHRDEVETAEPAADEDEALAVRAAQGDRRAFEALVRRHYDLVHRVAWRQTGSIDDAQDIAQDVLHGLVGSIGGFRGEARFTTWLTGITINACRDHGRRRGGFGRMRRAFAVVAGLAAGPDGRDLYRRTWLKSLLGALKPDLRETVVLVIGEELSHAEAARQLGISENTVAWRMHQVRKHLMREGDLGRAAARAKETRDER